MHTYIIFVWGGDGLGRTVTSRLNGVGVEVQRPSAVHLHERDHRTSQGKLQLGAPTG